MVSILVVVEKAGQFPIWVPSVGDSVTCGSRPRHPVLVVAQV